MPTPTLEEYLEAIYKLSREQPARPSELAAVMSVSAPTVTATLRRLSDRKLIDRPRGGVALTAEGERSALSILRRHRLAERFLVDTLGLPWDDVHDDACLLEHALSPRVQAALDEFLDGPDRCPHGHPIPDAKLRMPSDAPASTGALDAAPRGSDVTVVVVEERDGKILSEVASAGLLPGTVVRVVAGDDEQLEIEVDGVRHTISIGAAAAVGVSEGGGARG